jgi:3-oxoacyl-[acyl-carrier protein] reductase
MDLKLNGNVAVVTGAGSPYGYGRAIALTLAQEGCDLVVTYHKNAEGAEKTAADIRELGRKALAIQADVRLGPEVKQMVNTVINRFGKIDILVNNAGGPAVSPRPFVETDESDWNQDIDLNLKGTLQCTRAVLEHMLARRRGKIIHIIDVSAYRRPQCVCL